MVSAPERSCVVCRGKAQKSTLLRVVWTEGGAVIDRLQRLPGRGGYLHRSWECWSRMRQPARWARALRLDGSVDVSDGLQRAFHEIREMLDPEPEQADAPRKRAVRKGSMWGVPKGALRTKKPPSDTTS